MFVWAFAKNVETTYTKVVPRLLAHILLNTSCVSRRHWTRSFFSLCTHSRPRSLGHAVKFLSDACACGVGMVTKPRPNLSAKAAKSSNLSALPHQTCYWQVHSCRFLSNSAWNMQENSATTAASAADLEEYILRWNDHGVSFFKLAENLLQQELLTDVTIWCGDRVFDAHR